MGWTLCLKKMHMKFPFHPNLTNQDLALADMIQQAALVPIQTPPMGVESPTQSDESDEDREHIGKNAHGRQQDTDVLMEPLSYRNFMHDKGVQIAPGKGNRPFGMMNDLTNEEKCFPRAFCGQPMKHYRQRKVPISYQKLAQHHLMRLSDRRVASNTTHIFYKMRKMQIIKLMGARHVRMRKLKGVENITAKQARQPDVVDRMIHHDEAYAALSTLRGSPDYLKQCKQHAFAMIRQLAVPTWFCTLTSRGHMWKDLMQMLSISVDKVERAMEDFEGWSYEEKYRLIKADPVTVVQYFHQRVQAFLTIVMKNCPEAYGLVTDLFGMSEYHSGQGR